MDIFMKARWFILIAFISGEIINAVFLLPIIKDFYEHFMNYSFLLRSLIWILLYILIPTIIGSVAEFFVLQAIKLISR
jgi:hypothetical protein